MIRRTAALIVSSASLLAVASFSRHEAERPGEASESIARSTLVAHGGPGELSPPPATPRAPQTRSTVRLTSRQTEDDYPAAAVGPDGTVWLVYVEYERGRPIIMEEVRNRRFSSLVTEGHGDRIRLMRFDGEVWHPPFDVTGGGLDVWRPTVAVDDEGSVFVAWAQAIDGDWEILCRKYSPAMRIGEPSDESGGWSDTIRVTESPGSDFHVVSTTDRGGRVWLAWQAWRGDNFDIQVARIETSGAVTDIALEANTAANEWSPALAADTRGNVFLAWDSYENGNYDVRLQRFGAAPRTIVVAGSPRFEARASIACDLEGRLWIAYERGDEQWGKDYTLPVEWGRHRGEIDPGFGLYVHRTINVKCLVGDRLMQPAHDVASVLAAKLSGNTSLPRIAADQSGGIWLSLRRHMKPTDRGGGEAWHTYALRYDGKQWSSPKQLPDSVNLLDNRPALAQVPKGLLAVYSSDSRKRTEQRDQNDLFAFRLKSRTSASRPKLVAPRQTANRTVAVVHPNERADVARMRNVRLNVGGKPLRLLRGEFHRHTEYTAHRDGDGLLEDSWRYALDAARLDWMGNGDHDSGYGHEYHWWQIQKVTDLLHNPPGFIAVHSYERSNGFPNGHRNVILPRRGVRPLPRGSLKGSPEEGTPDTKLLYDYLRQFGGICASHTSATSMGTDWRDHDPQVEPIVEIFQGCRQEYQSYEHLGAPRAAPEPHRYQAGYVWNALGRGHRLGFQASSDHLSTHISYAVVLAEEASRRAIIEAFQKRHCYAANDNLVLIVRSGKHVMGDVFATAGAPDLQIQVHAPKPVSKLHVIRNNRYVFTAQPGKAQFELRYTDVDVQPGRQYYYYVRVQQEDGSLAWSSPLWITYDP